MMLQTKPEPPTASNGSAKKGRDKNFESPVKQRAALLKKRKQK